ncbi:MAG TPA: electron-transfer flavoprotein:ubiquinone oxidoreductase [Gemmatimonadales bacterium]|nr:electron-transfer flavoprotein:ubiquinone oxidoreductase [Gemmatimonadales bacterium]
MRDPSAFVPSTYQPGLLTDRVIRSDPPGPEAIELDVLFVGAGPAGLAGAIELTRLVAEDNRRGGSLGDVSIGVLEKGERLGDHCLSGAVVNPVGFRTLFPDLADADFPFGQPVTREAVYLLSERRAFRVPTPPTMRNHGFFVASLCEMVRWLGQRAEQLGVHIFPGYPAAGLLVDGRRVVGVRTAASGLDRQGQPGAGFLPPTDLTAKVTALAEGTRGLLTQAYLEWQRIPSSNPQVFALGVKELWETKRPLHAVMHTLGWPLPPSVFGGSFMYPLAPNVVALGLVAALDGHDGSLDTHELFQRMKLHPLFRPHLAGGEVLEWGAKTIPEGGYYSLPARRHGDGVVILGDAAGLVNVPALKGIHYAMQSGVYAARAIFQALKRGDTSAKTLAEYDVLLSASSVMRDLYRTRNMRLAFRHGFVAGAVSAGLATLTGGLLPLRRIAMRADAAVARSAPSAPRFVPDGKLTFSKVDAVFRSGNATRDSIPSHLVTLDAVPRAVAEFYARMCPAGVYEWVDGALRVNAPNCVDCKATDVLGPRWTPREGGSGPRYSRM